MQPSGFMKMHHYHMNERNQAPWRWLHGYLDFCQSLAGDGQVALDIDSSLEEYSLTH